MTLSHRARLQQTQTFPQLIRFLRDEMGWPIESEDFEDLTFTYTLEELGIDSGSAAKSAEIKRLRPLVLDQPWGIFFVKFEPKRLPVVALRRILSAFVMRKRASANSADRMTWETDDLLFISSYGEDEERQLSFAHFSPSVEGGSLPALKVLDWDNRDTALHLDAVAATLTQRLVWPANDADVEHWRESWRSAFTLRHREVVTTSRELSVRLAELARAIRDRINAALAIETDTGPLTKLMTAFREALVHDLTPDGFADMYAQTIAYGLLSARIADPKSKTASDVGAHMRTNPLLRDLMTTFLSVGGKHDGSSSQGLDFDELGVGEVVDLLDDPQKTNIDAVIRDFGDRNPDEDPVIHFYELFLKEYDAKKRVMRGVFYTPRPVVSCIVRSVHQLLRTEYGLVDGLADTATWGEVLRSREGGQRPDGVADDDAFVQILDPATGTGTFLVEVIEVVHQTMVAKWSHQGTDEQTIQRLWNDYVPRHLLPRLHAYELLMAPYAIAHLKVGLKLYETGYRFAGGERARIYLTNALEPASHLSQQSFSSMLPALAREAQAVDDIKRSLRFTVVLGNPPYAGNSSNRGEWIESLVNDYRHVDGKPLGEFKVWLKDDYVKFIRFGEHLIGQAGAGILGYITNNSFFDGLTYRGMRSHLLMTFGHGYFLNLHGNANLLECAPDGSPDENVFDIRQGVGVSVLSKAWSRPEAKTAYAADLYGKRVAKYGALNSIQLDKGTFSLLRVSSPNYFVTHQDETGSDDYATFTRLPDLFPLGGLGFQSHRDSFVVAQSAEELADRMQVFFDLSLSDEAVETQFGIGDYRRFRVHDYRRENAFDPAAITRVQYRPFDYRYVYYARDIVQEWQFRFHGHMLQPNLGLNVMRQTKSPRWGHVMVSSTPTPAVFVEIKDGSSQYPLYLYDQAPDSLLAQMPAGVPNFSLDVVTPWLRRLGVTLAQVSAGTGADDRVRPEDIFNYVYAVLHSPGYRTRYETFLKTDFPRVPLADDASLFWLLSRIGRRLVAAHLLETPTEGSPLCAYSGSPDPTVQRVAWADNAVWLQPMTKARDGHGVEGSPGFLGVARDVWDFRVGGYQVCEKWLKDRRGRVLSDGDIAHYQRIVVALSETIRLMGEIDEVIEEHGGWPGAFVSLSS